MIVTPFRTRMGWVALLANDHSLIEMTLPHPTRRAALGELHSRPRSQFTFGENDLTRRARVKLVDYFAGRRVGFDDLPVDDSAGTEFQRRVWQLTRAIQYGSTRTYRDLARSAGRPNAARAIGQCMAHNPLPIIIPCHRVVGCDGGLRGFGGGMKMKRTLLEMEGAF